MLVAVEQTVHTTLMVPQVTLPALRLYVNTRYTVNSAQARPGFFLRALPSSCIDFSSPEGKLIFAEALTEGTQASLPHLTFVQGTMENYFKLAGHYYSQSEPAYCGIAVLCMVLNSLAAESRTHGRPRRWYR